MVLAPGSCDRTSLFVAVSPRSFGRPTVPLTGRGGRYLSPLPPVAQRAEGPAARWWAATGRRAHAGTGVATPWGVV